MGETRILHLKDRVSRKIGGHFGGGPRHTLRGTVDMIYADGSFCIMWDDGRITHEKRYSLYAFPANIKS